MKNNGLSIGSGNYQLTILKTPNDRFKFVGSIPEILCVEMKQKNGLPYVDCPSYSTEKELRDYYKEKIGEEFNGSVV